MERNALEKGEIWVSRSVSVAGAAAAIRAPRLDADRGRCERLPFGDSAEHRGGRDLSGHVYSDPVENVEEALNSAPPGREAPVSPTDPFKRLQALI